MKAIPRTVAVASVILSLFFLSFNVPLSDAAAVWITPDDSSSVEIEYGFPWNMWSSDGHEAVYYARNDDTSDGCYHSYLSTGDYSNGYNNRYLYLWSDMDGYIKNATKVRVYYNLYNYNGSWYTTPSNSNYSAVKVGIRYQSNFTWNTIYDGSYSLETWEEYSFSQADINGIRIEPKIDGDVTEQAFYVNETDFYGYELASGTEVTFGQGEFNVSMDVTGYEPETLDSGEFNVSMDIVGLQTVIEGEFNVSMDVVSPVTYSEGEFNVSMNVTMNIQNIDFSYTIDQKNKTVYFTPNIQEGISNYTWLFGDNTTAYNMTVNHTYSEYGTYPVTLKVRPEAGAIQYYETKNIELKKPSVDRESPWPDTIQAVVITVILILVIGAFMGILNIFGCLPDIAEKLKRVFK